MTLSIPTFNTINVFTVGSKLHIKQCFATDFYLTVYTYIIILVVIV